MEWTAQAIRQAFLDFFRERDHRIIPSAPLVPHNDPTLLFVNAGMNPFKEIFLGQKEAEYPRIANTQKCLRVSGKHNDLEQVGHDGYHHTFFEMLGNWSFGDYFKREAIEWAWRLLTEVYGLPADRLYATVFPGTKDVPRDEESWRIWQEIVPEGHLLWGTPQDNFWEMGEEGPCGPCTEIHIDLRTEAERSRVDARQLINQNHPQVIELWNIVFIEYTRRADGKLERLSQHFVDTGMGLERLTMVMQRKRETYETDLLLPIIHRAEEITGTSWDDPEEKIRVALRVLADHTRAIGFAIADGVLPSNTGRGYVIRRLLRRAVRYAYQYLGYKDPLVSRLVTVLPEIYGEVFPEVLRNLSTVVSVVREEERNFLRVIARGLARFYTYLDYLRRTQQESGSESGVSRVIPGDIVFTLYDTYGFPADLTALLAREEGFTIDEAGFQQRMKQQRERARQAQQRACTDWQIMHDGKTIFVGYDTLEVVTRVLRWRQCRTASGKTYYEIALEYCPFYPEGGGQVGDSGLLIEPATQTTHRVVTTYRYHDLILVRTETVPSSSEVIARVDIPRRQEIMKHHSATHLLHASLRTILGKHVRQSGSFLNETYLRFDFTHPRALTPEEIARIEELVNQKIQENIPLQEERDVPLEEALRRGALAFFGEKYGDRVRVVAFDPSFSMELCGGTHVPATGMIGLFKIVRESGVAAGVRRIEARAGLSAYQWVHQQIDILSRAKEQLKTPDILAGIDRLLTRNKELEKEKSHLLHLLVQWVYEAIERERLAKGLSPDDPLIFSCGALPYEGLRQLVFRLRKEKEFPLIVLVSEAREKGFTGQVVIHARRPYSAVALVEGLRRRVRGKGGGSPTFATYNLLDSVSGSEVVQWVSALVEEVVRQDLG